MHIRVTRRDALRVAGGSAVGVLLTPAPWKLVDDVAIWTQNWPWLPKPPQGKLTNALTVCSLCAAACPVRARCVGGVPVSLAPAGSGACGRRPCPLGLAGHHLAFHPNRLNRPSRLLGRGEEARVLPVQPEAVLAAIAGAKGRGTVGVLDQRPGRTVSWAWRRVLAGVADGVYIPTPGRQDRSAATLRRMLNGPWGPPGLDVAGAGAVLSVGGSLPAACGATARRTGRTRLFHAGARSTEGALAADVWLPVKPGGEAALALGLANVLVRERLVDVGRARAIAGDLDAFLGVVARHTPEAVAPATGLPAGAIAAVARELAARRPALAVPVTDLAAGPLAREAEAAVWALDVVLGSVGRSGVVARAEAPLPDDLAGPLAAEVELEDVPDHSLAALVVDASQGDPPIPWAAVERALAPGAAVVALSPFLAGFACHAGYVVPTPAFLEGVQEVPAPAFATAAGLAVSVPILRPPDGAVDPVGFVRAFATALGSTARIAFADAEGAARGRVRKLFETRRGVVVPPTGGEEVRVASLPGPDELWKALAAGSRWRDDAPAPAPPPQLSLLSQLRGGEASASAARLRGEGAFPLTLIPAAAADVAASAAVSPVLGKLYRESGLRRAAGEVSVHPDTGVALALRPGARARLATATGEAPVVVRFDAAVAPGVVEAVVAPTPRALGERAPVRGAELLRLFTARRDGSWRGIPARLEEA